MWKNAQIEFSHVNFSKNRTHLTNIITRCCPRILRSANKRKTLFNVIINVQVDSDNQFYFNCQSRFTFLSNIIYTL